MQQKYIDFELDADDMRLFAQFTKYMRTVLWRARRDYLEKEKYYAKRVLLEDRSIDEQYNIVDPAATEELERLVNWEMIKSHMKVLTLREAEVITDIFIKGLTQAECAACIGISQKSVSKHYRNALQKLKESMEGDSEYGGF